MARQKDSTVSLEALSASFRQGKFSPLYLFTGEEEYLMEEYLDILVEHALDESSRSFNFDILYGGEVDGKDVVSLASLFPMMAERRVVIVRDAEKLVASEENRDILMRYLGRPLSSTVLVFVTPKADLRLSVFKVFQQQGIVVEAKSLYESDIPEWIEKRVKKLGRSISPEACELLHAHVGNSLRELHNEIEKVFLYVGERKSISVEDISAVVGMSKSYNVFELQRAIGAGNASRSMEILERMLDVGENPIGIVVMLTRFFQKLWILPSVRRHASSEYELASKLQVRPYFVREYLTAVKHFPAGRIEQAFTALLQADVTLKTTQEDPKAVMTTMLYKLLKPVEVTLLSETF
jgi:DNA polymerase-3 subunit delta